MPVNFFIQDFARADSIRFANGKSIVVQRASGVVKFFDCPFFTRDVSKCQIIGSPAGYVIGKLKSHSKNQKFVAVLVGTGEVLLIPVGIVAGFFGGAILLPAEILEATAAAAVFVTAGAGGLTALTVSASLITFIDAANPIKRWNAAETIASIVDTTNQDKFSVEEFSKFRRRLDRGLSTVKPEAIFSSNKKLKDIKDSAVVRHTTTDPARKSSRIAEVALSRP